MMPRKRYPPIPKVMYGLGGDVPVTVVSAERIKRFADPGETLWGYFHDSERYIEVVDTMSLEAQWRTLWHEWAHSVLRDSGIANGLGDDGKLEEAICDAVSSALMRTLYRS